MKKIFSIVLMLSLVASLFTVTPKVEASTATFIMPAEGTITSGFRPSHRPNHNGIDIAKSGVVPIKASASGTVIYSGFHTNSDGSPGYGNFVAIRHNINGETYLTKYGHMKYTPRVSVGQTVSQGQVIGEMGNTGKSTGQHLHFEILKGTTNIWAADTHAVNPLNYIGVDLGPAPHQYDGTWATLRINTASGGPVNVFGHPGYGLKGTLPNGTSYKVYSKAYSSDGHGYFDVGNSTWILETHVVVTPYRATVDFQHAVNVYSSPNGAYKGRVNPGETFRTYGARDGWYDLGQSTWIKAEYVRVVR